MIKQKPSVKNFHVDDGQDLLLKGDVDLVLEYNGDIAQVMIEDKDIDFIVPKEGSQLNSDNLCIPKGAPHPKNAHAFINYLLDAEVDKKITETILFPTPNNAAKALMPDSYKNNPVIFPPADVLAKCEYAKFNPELAADVRGSVHAGSGQPDQLKEASWGWPNRTGKRTRRPFWRCPCRRCSGLLSSSSFRWPSSGSTASARTGD